jgi:hypothetical protein
MTERRLRFVIFLDGPGLWVVRGLEHDLTAEAHTIGQALRSAARLVMAHAEFDVRHHLEPLSAFPAAAQSYWNAYAAGTPIPLDQLGVMAPPGWDIHAAFATRLPSDKLPRTFRSAEAARPRPAAPRVAARA